MMPKKDLVSSIIPFFIRLRLKSAPRWELKTLRSNYDLGDGKQQDL